MLLAGSFSEYPLFLLLEIFLNRRETGLLEVSSSSQSGYFYIRNGEIKDGEVGKLKGAQAVELAASLTDASFQFKALEPAEYARVVWEKSFGSPDKGLADTPHTGVQAFHSALRQFLFYALAAYHRLEKAVVSTAGRTLSYATAAYEFTHTLATTKVLPSLRQATAEWQIALRGYAGQFRQELILKYAWTLRLERAFVLIRNRAAMLPALLQEPVRRRVSFAAITTALLIATLVTISQIGLRRKQDHVATVATTAGDFDNQSQAQSKPVSREGSKREGADRATPPGLTQMSIENDKRSTQRFSRQIPTEKKRDTSLTQKSSFLRQARVSTIAPAPTNPASDSDGAKRQAATTAGVQDIAVVLQIENRHVSQASVFKHRPGMEGYEAAALRIARQRRYPAGAKRTDIVIVKINKP